MAPQLCHHKMIIKWRFIKPVPSRTQFIRPKIFVKLGEEGFKNGSECYAVPILPILMSVCSLVCLLQPHYG